MLCKTRLDGHRGNRVRGAAYGLASAAAVAQLAAANTALRGEARAVATATHMCACLGVDSTLNRRNKDGVGSAAAQFTARPSPPESTIASAATACGAHAVTTTTNCVAAARVAFSKRPDDLPGRARGSVVSARSPAKAKIAMTGPVR